MSHGIPLCSFKRACQADLGSSLQSGCWAFWGRENSGSTAEVFLLADLRQDVGKYIRSYTAYAIAKPSNKKQGLYTLFPTPSRLWESISMDYMSGLPYTKHGNDCVFVVVDRFSKMAIMAAYKKNITAEAIAKLFFE